MMSQNVAHRDNLVSEQKKVFFLHILSQIFFVVVPVWFFEVKKNDQVVVFSVLSIV